MNSLNNLNADLTAIFETIKELKKKYSNDFFGIELKNRHHKILLITARNRLNT